MNKIENIKLIACDIDGTLINSNGECTFRTVEAIKKQEKKELNLRFVQVDL